MGIHSDKNLMELAASPTKAAAEAEKDQWLKKKGKGGKTGAGGSSWKHWGAIVGEQVITGIPVQNDMRALHGFY